MRHRSYLQRRPQLSLTPLALTPLGRLLGFARGPIELHEPFRGTIPVIPAWDLDRLFSCCHPLITFDQQGSASAYFFCPAQLGLAGSQRGIAATLAAASCGGGHGSARERLGVNELPLRDVGQRHVRSGVHRVRMLPETGDREAAKLFLKRALANPHNRPAGGFCTGWTAPPSGCHPRIAEGRSHATPLPTTHATLL